MELRVKEIAKAKGIQMQQLADTLGINRVTLTSTINGNPTIGTLEKIAAALQVDFIELFERPSDGNLNCPNCGATLRIIIEKSK